MKKNNKNLYIVVHKHRYGESAYVVRSKKMPTIKKVVKVCKIDFEPEREDEWIEVLLVDNVIEI